MTGSSPLKLALPHLLAPAFPPHSPIPFNLSKSDFKVIINHNQGNDGQAN